MTSSDLIDLTALRTEMMTIIAYIGWRDKLEVRVDFMLTYIELSLLKLCLTTQLYTACLSASYIFFSFINLLDQDSIYLVFSHFYSFVKIYPQLVYSFSSSKDLKVMLIATPKPD